MYIDQSRAEGAASGLAAHNDKFGDADGDDAGPARPARDKKRPTHKERRRLEAKRDFAADKSAGALSNISSSIKASKRAEQALRATGARVHKPQKLDKAQAKKAAKSADKAAAKKTKSSFSADLTQSGGKRIGKPAPKAKVTDVLAPGPPRGGGGSRGRGASRGRGDGASRGRGGSRGRGNGGSKFGAGTPRGGGSNRGGSRGRGGAGRGRGRGRG